MKLERRDMAPTTATHIENALEQLTKYYFDKFVFHLQEKPQVRRREVEGKSVPEITELLLLKFTRDGALQVTLQILRHIDCNQVAEDLVLKTKAPIDTGDPVLRKTPNGELDLNPSKEADRCAADHWPNRATSANNCSGMKKPEEVEDEAKARVVSEGGDPSNSRLVLSRYSIQFGQYKDKTFKWLLENDLGYAAYLVAEHQKEREYRKHQSPHMANKDSLTSYAIAYREVLNEVRFHRRYIEAKERSMQPGQEGEALVGFGKYREETLKDLYESPDRNKISYVQFLLKKKSTCNKGSKMMDAIKYFLQRDKAKKRPRNRKQTQSTRKTSHLHGKLKKAQRSRLCNK